MPCRRLPRAIVAGRVVTVAPDGRPLSHRWRGGCPEPGKVFEPYLEPPRRQPEVAETRPHARGDCSSSPRPCPWVGCRYHLALKVSSCGTVFLDRRFLAGELRETCALDVAERGGLTLEGIGQLLGLTRERVRQIELSAISHAAALASQEGNRQ